MTPIKYLRDLALAADEQGITATGQFLVNIGGAAEPLPKFPFKIYYNNDELTKENLKGKTNNEYNDGYWFTDDSGDYKFEELELGSYTVKVRLYKILITEKEIEEIVDKKKIKKVIKKVKLDVDEQSYELVNGKNILKNPLYKTPFYDSKLLVATALNPLSEEFLDKIHKDSNSVTKIQEVLKCLEYYKGKINGDYGGDTKEGVKKFQDILPKEDGGESPKPNVNGKVDGITLLVLAKVYRMKEPHVVRIKKEDGKAFTEIKLRLIEPGQPHEGIEVVTDKAGEIQKIKIFKKIAGDWFLSSAEYELMPETLTSKNYPVVDITTIHRSGSLPDPTHDFPLRICGIDDIVARQVFYIICPMCGMTFKSVKKPSATSANPSPPDNLCPNDNFNLTTIEAEIEANPKSFMIPKVGQKPSLTPVSLTSRGAKEIDTAHGKVTVYWDESRFLSSDDDDYILWGKSPSGSVKSVSIVGRKKWGAKPPVLGSGRVYEFHETKLGVSPAYTFSIPSNENLQLSSVLKWITIHHTTDKAQNSFSTAIALQSKHQTEGIGGSPAADIGYHFIIDANGSIYEGRPLGIKGSHVELFNGGNIGIALAGDFESRVSNFYSPDIPTTSAIKALDDLVDVLAWRFGVMSVWSHTERKKQSKAGDTECPGEKLIPHVHTMLRSKYPGPPP